MATFQITGPDGKKYRVTGDTAEGALQALQRHLGGAQPQQPRVDPTTNQPPGVPAYQPPGVEGYDPMTGEVAREPRSMLASAAHGAADVAGMGFTDELASYAGSTLTGVPRNQVLAEMRGLQKQAKADNPWSYMGGQAAGGIAQGVVAGPATMTAKMGGSTLARAALGGAIDGAVAGGLYGAGSGEDLKDRAVQSGIGALTGGAIGGAMPYVVAGASKAAKRLVSPFPASQERTAAAELLRSEGVPVTAGQQSGNRVLRTVESEIGPRAVYDKQKDAFTSAVLKRAGINAIRATPEVLDDAFRTVGQQFDDLASRNSLIPDRQMVTEMRSVVTNYGHMTNESARKPIVEKLAKDILGVSKNGTVSGDAYQKLSKELAKAARGVGGDYETKTALLGLRDALDGAMERSMLRTGSRDVGAWRVARTQYRNLLPIEDAATRAGEEAAEGIITPANLRNAAIKLQGKRAYARGKGEFGDLARAGSMLLKHPPDSGTAIRTAVRNLGIPTGAAGVGGLVAGIPGAVAGFAAPWAAGQAVMSKPIQAYLVNQLATGSINPALRDSLALLASSAARPPAIGR